MRPGATVLQPLSALSPEPGQLLVGRTHATAAGLSRFHGTQARYNNAADKKLSTKRRQMGIFMAVHPGSLATGQEW